MSNEKKSKEQLRLLRGDELAKNLVHFNGHQKKLRIAKFFEPIWLAMVIIPMPFMTMLPILKSIIIIGLIGIAFEMGLIVYFMIKHKRVDAYPGLDILWSQLVKRTLMVNGRPGSDHSKP